MILGIIFNVGRMVLKDSDREILLVRNIHLIAKSVSENRTLSDSGVIAIKENIPELYNVLRSITFKEAIEALSKYRDHPLYRNNIYIALSPEGRQWMENGLSFIRAFSNRDEEIDGTNP